MLRAAGLLLLLFGMPALAGWKISQFTSKECSRVADDADTSWTVVFALNSTCPLSRQYAPEIGRIVSQPRLVPIRFHVMQVNDARQDSLFGFGNTRMVMDEKGTLAARFHLNTVPAVLVYRGNPFDCYRPERVWYQGAIDNWAISLGKHRLQVTEPYLLRALEAAERGMPAVPAFTRAVGCYTETFRH
ncbi:MAG: hypothetical protein ACK5U7_14810 [Bacteroidota bacterium]